jgi:quinolinate synthase
MAPLTPKKAAQAARVRELAEALGCEMLSHFFTRGEVRGLSHFVGGTRAILARALESPAEALAVCAPDFITATVRRLRPDIPVLIPREDSECPMSREAGLRLITDLKKARPNSILCAGLRAHESVRPFCDTIVDHTGALDPDLRGPGKEVIVVPELTDLEGRPIPHLAHLAPACQVHRQIGAKEVLELKRLHPGAALLADSLCRPEVLAAADFAGGSDDLFARAQGGAEREYIVVSEAGLMEAMAERLPEKTFLELQTEVFCPSMKLINIRDILSALEGLAERSRAASGPRAGEGGQDDLFGQRRHFVSQA